MTLEGADHDHLKAEINPAGPRRRTAPRCPLRAVARPSSPAGRIHIRTPVPPGIDDPRRTSPPVDPASRRNS
ncbi:hypothetical protein WBG99_22820 [Streptomyces sp. TG1A-60]|uniref:hypothetical protein n=1 Tax=Streptomyces sp. TG1A-60 TaxID=3129111 RepID=UPI0030CB0ECE